MPDMEEIAIHSAGLKFAALAWGRPEEPPLLALHGWMDNAESLAEVGRRLKGFRVFAPDLAGHGRSSHRPPGLGYDDVAYARDVIALADALELDSFFLLGHSMGGGIAALVAGAVPSRVRGVVTIEALGVVPARERDAPLLLGRWQRRIRKLQGRAPERFASVDAAVAARMRGMTPIGGAEARRLVSRNLHCTPDGLAWRVDPRVALPPPSRLIEAQVRHFLRRITCPVRVVLGREGMASIHGPIVERARCVDDVEVRWLPGGHHLHMGDAAGPIAEVARALLRAEPEPRVQGVR